MSSKSKESFKDKLKSLFHISKNNGSADSSGNISGPTSSSIHHRSVVSKLISPSVIRSISPETDITIRLKSLTDLVPLVSTKLLEDGAVENLWICVQDLVQSTDFSQRRAGMEFMIALCKGQSNRMGLCRAIFCDHLKTVNTIKDGDHGGIELKLYTELLKALCRDGQDVSDFEEEIGPLCLIFLYEYLRRKEAASDFLRLLQNVIKFHAAYFDEDVTRSCVRYVCILACRTNKGKPEWNDEIIACLNVLDAVLCHGCWPRGTLLVVVTALCKLMNSDALHGHCWKFMRNLLTSPYGHGTVYTMCSLMQASQSYPDESILRGAVFFVGASLWSDEKVDDLRHTPASVLSSMLRALESNSPVVTHEVALSVQQLIRKHGDSLQLLTWDLLLQILERLFAVTDTNDKSTMTNASAVSHDTLTTIENLHTSQHFNGSSDQLFNLVESVAKTRPTESILRLVAYRTQSLSPTRGNWLSQLQALLDTYYKREQRQSVRADAVRILRNLYVQHRYLHGDELVEVVVLPVFAEVSHEADQVLQADVVRLIIDIAKTSTQNCYFELLSIVERILDHKMEQSSQYFANIELALCGLIDIAKVKWNTTPSNEALQALHLLTKYLISWYSKDCVAEAGSPARTITLKFLLSLGAEIGSHRLVYKDSEAGHLVTSAYIVCADPDDDASPPHSPLFAGAGRLTDFSGKDMVKTFALAIQKERYVSVLHLLLTELPIFLLNRRLAISDIEGIATICRSAIRLCNDPKSFVLVAESKDKMTTADIKEDVYGLLTALISFRTYFDQHLQKQLASTIQNGITDQKSGYAVVSTVSCLLEMPDIMSSNIKGLIRRLNTLPSAPTIAIPVLELFSTLMRMHDLYKDFTLDDFEHVVQTLTSYMDPFMFTDFIVAVAYQVLFRWFLRMPLRMRSRVSQTILNRSSDILKKHPRDNGNSSPDNVALWKAFDDAREVCIAFLAYYSFTDIPPSYERSQISLELFGKNPSRHWVIGDRIFSITSSGNTAGCQACTRRDPEAMQLEKTTKELPNKEDFLSNRRRHASAIPGPTATTRQQYRPVLDDTCLGSTGHSSMAPYQGYSFSATNEDVPNCLCWCRDWMELTIRHAVGRQAWSVRVTNEKSHTDFDIFDFIERSCTNDGDETTANMEDILLGNEGNLIMNLDSEVKSTFSVDDTVADAMSGDRNVSKSAIRHFTIDAATSKRYQDASKARRRFSSVPFSGDVRSFLLQLFSANIGKDVSKSDASIVALTDGEAVERAIKNLDRVSAYETYKIGVVYIGSRQTTETEILGNQYGSARYEKFISGLGKLISLKDADPSQTYIGGLDTTGKDGEFTYHWSDQTCQAIFHIATRMPNKENDPNFQQKKLHIGNDFVAIVFNEGGYDYKLSTISGQFARVAVIVQPLDDKILHIKLLAKNEISSWLTMKEATMSDEQAPLLCRQMAIRADASSRIWEQKKAGEPVLSRTAERLRQIKSIKERFGRKPLTVETMFD